MKALTILVSITLIFLLGCGTVAPNYREENLITYNSMVGTTWFNHMDGFNQLDRFTFYQDSVTIDQYVLSPANQGPQGTGPFYYNIYVPNGPERTFLGVFQDDVFQHDGLYDGTLCCGYPTVYLEYDIKNPLNPPLTLDANEVVSVLHLRGEILSKDEPYVDKYDDSYLTFEVRWQLYWGYAPVGNSIEQRWFIWRDWGDTCQIGYVDDPDNYDAHYWTYVLDCPIDVQWTGWYVERP